MKLELFVFFALLNFVLFYGNFCLAAEEDFGVSLSVGADKKLISVLNIGMDAEVRSNHNSEDLERLAIGGVVGYKPIDYFKIELGYTFIDQFEPEAEKNEVCISSYWAPKHELEATVLGMLPIDFIELSLRFRYEYTWHHEVKADQWRKNTPKETIIAKAHKTEHVLRSRLQLSAKIPDTMFSLYGSFDVYHNLADVFKFINIRYLLGINYTFIKQHTPGVYVRVDSTQGSPNNYLLGFKYKYAF